MKSYRRLGAQNFVGRNAVQQAVSRRCKMLAELTASHAPCIAECVFSRIFQQASPGQQSMSASNPTKEGMWKRKILSRATRPQVGL
jgi:hypothetical protein